MRCICVGVPLERQKLMIAGQSITDEMWNETALKKIKPVSTVMMTREREREREFQYYYYFILIELYVHVDGFG